VPVVEPDARPLRVKPTDVGGMKVDGADDAILSGQGDGKAALSPPTEVPAPQALKAAAEADSAATTVASPPPAPAAPTAAAAAVETQAAAPEPVAVMPRVAAVRPAPMQAAPARPAAKVAMARPVPVAPPDVPTAASVIRPVMPAAAAPAHAVAHPAAAPAHGPLIQLAAVGSEQAAQSEWQRLSKKMPDLLGGRTPVISKYEHDGKTFWRLRTGGFADPAAAKAFCGRLSGKGAACAVIGA
jgi:hypothetical protein